MANSNGTGGSDGVRALFGAIIVVIGLLVVAGVFVAAITRFSDAKDIVAVVGAVTGVVATIVTAFFGIHATASAGADASRMMADASNKAIAAAAYAGAEKALELLEKLNMVLGATVR